MSTVAESAMAKQDKVLGASMEEIARAFGRADRAAGGMGKAGFKFTPAMLKDVIAERKRKFVVTRGGKQ